MTDKNKKPCINCGKICRGLRCRQCSNKICPPATGRIVSEKTRQQISKKLIGHVPWNKGTKQPVPTKMTKQELSVFNRKRMLGEKNPAKRPEVKEKIRNTLLQTYKNNPEIVEKIRTTLLNTYNNNPEILENRKICNINQYTNTYTSIEKKIAEVLTSMNVLFIHNFKIGRYTADFLIFNYIVIECDGSYWHQNKISDYKRDKNIFERGYIVVRFSDYMINKNINICIKTILAIQHRLHRLTKQGFNLDVYLGHRKAAGFQCKELPFKRLS